MAYSLILGNLVIDHLFAGINFDARDIFCIEILPHMVSTKLADTMESSERFDGVIDKVTEMDSYLN